MAKKPALTPEEAKKEALGTALTTIEHKYGKGAVMRLSDHPAIRISSSAPRRNSVPARM